MAPPSAATMQRLARECFRSYGIVLPAYWVAPSSDVEREQYAATGGQDAGPELPPDALFVSATPSLRHHAVVMEMSRAVGAFLDGACDAVCGAWAEWQQAACLEGVRVERGVARGGSVRGPAWKAAIIARGPAGTSQARRYTRAIAVALGEAWGEYVASIQVPALEWFPALENAPSGEVVPVENIPTALTSLTQRVAVLAPTTLQARMAAALGDEGAAHHMEIFGAIASAFNMCFEAWRCETMVTRVIARGEIAVMEPGGFV